MTQILTRPCRIVVLSAVAWLAGCAAPPAVAPPAPATIEAPAVTSSPAARAPGVAYAWSDRFDASAQRLRGSLSGGDVKVSQTTDQRLWVSLSVDAAFPPGRSALKPPATTWLDQVAVALRELPRAEVQIVSDADAVGSGNRSRTMALERAASARDWLVIRGVAARRISVAARIAGSSATDSHRLDILIGERSRGQGEAAR